MAVAFVGYRIGNVSGHDRSTFAEAKLSNGKQAGRLADYFDACLRKRNEIYYRAAIVLAIVVRLLRGD